jgi:hypothetical protein
MGLYPFPQYLVWLIRKSGFPQENDEDEDNLEAQLEGQTAENPGGQFGNFLQRMCFFRCHKDFS